MIKRTQQLVFLLNRTNDFKQREDLIKDIILLNNNLIEKYVGYSGYSAYKKAGCERGDAKNIFIIYLMRALNEGKIMNWEKDFPTVFLSVLNETKRELFSQYIDGGIKCSYSTLRNIKRSGKKPPQVSSLSDDICDLDSHTSVEEEIVNKELIERINEFLSSAYENGIINDKEYSCIISHYYEGKTFEEIAKQLGEYSSTVRTRCCRTLKRLKKFSDDYGLAIDALL